MSDQSHCPFLNRSDDRCSNNFSLERLNNTYDYCFGQYSACPVYLELLLERRVRRMRESVIRLPERNHQPSRPYVEVTHHGQRIEAA